MTEYLLLKLMEFLESCFLLNYNQVTTNATVLEQEDSASFNSYQSNSSSKNKSQITEPTAHDVLPCRFSMVNVEKIDELEEIIQKNAHRTEIYSHFFSLACRGYGRVIRNLRQTSFYTLNNFLGRELESLQRVNLEQLDCKGIRSLIAELCDICNFFALVHHRLFINVKNPLLLDFLSKLLKEIFKNQDKIDEFRKISHRLKALRCAELYQLPAYEPLLNMLEEKFDSFLLFDYIALFNSILRGKPNAKVFYLQNKILLNAIRKILDKNWISISSSHSFNDLIFPISQFQSLLPYVFEGTQATELWKEVQKFLYENYKNLSNEEIIRYVKVIEKVNPNSKFSKDLAKAIFCRINPATGQSTLDPFFLTRFISHHKNFKLYQKTDPDWGNKFVAMIKYYFKQQKVSTRSVLEGIFTVLHSEGLTPKNRKTIFQQLYHGINLHKMDNPTKETGRNFAMFYKFSIISFQLNHSVQIIQNLQNILEGRPDSNHYFYHLMKQYNIMFLRQMGFFIHSNRKKLIINAQKQINPKAAQELNILTYLRNLASSNTDILPTVRNYNRMNMLYLQMTVELLRFNMMYEQLFKLFQLVVVGPTIMDVIYNRLTDQQVPACFHEQMNRMMMIPLKNYENLTIIYFNLLRQTKYKKKRSSKLQAQYFMSFLNRQQPTTKANFLADKEILSFLLCFQPQNTIGIIYNLLANEITLEDFQHVLVHTVFCLERYNNDLPFVFSHTEKIKNLSGLPEESLSKINKIMGKYENLENQILFMISQICKKQQFEDCEQNRAHLTKIFKLIEEKNEQKINQSLESINRILILLKRHEWTANRQSSLFVGRGLWQIIVRLVQNPEQTYDQILKAFALATDFRWNIPALHSECIKVIANEDWKMFMPVEPIFKQLCLYPHDEALTVQRMPDLIGLLTYNVEELLPYFQYFMTRRHADMKKTFFPNYLAYLKNLDFLKNKKHAVIEGPSKEQFLGIEQFTVQK